jgi:nucleoside-diphosphate-sugar epimerase
MLAISHPQKNETVLIAGAGDVGGRVARRLVAQGKRVIALRRGEVTPDPAIRWVRADLTRPETLRGLPKVDAVVFAPTPDARDEAAYRAVFLDGLRHLIDALPAPPRRTLFVSSTAVYGEHAGEWVDETTPTDPPGFNGRILVETENWLASRDIGGLALRLAGLYGPGRTQLLDRLRDGKVSVPRGQGVFANRIHVDDAAAAIAHLLSLDAPEALYVGVDDTPLPVDELYDYLAGLLGAAPPPDGPPAAGIGNKRMSNERLRSTGFQCRWPDARMGYAALI